MITPWTLYWITRLDCIRDIATVIIIIATLLEILTAVTLLVNSSFDDDDDDKFPARMVNTIARICKGSAAAIIVSTLLMIFLPTTKEMAVIVVVPAIANSEKVQKESQELYDLAKGYLKNILNVTSKKVEKKQ